MILNIRLACPYCDNCTHSYDTDTGAVVLNPDTANQVPCEHLCYAYFLSHPFAVDFSWINPLFPDSSEVLDFLAEAVHNPSTLPQLTTPFKIDENDLHVYEGQRKESWELMNDEDLHEDDDDSADTPQDFGPSREKAERLLNAPLKGLGKSVPKVPQDMTLHVCVLWSSQVYDLSAELKAAWR